MEILNKTKELISSTTAIAENFVYDRRCDVEVAKICARLKKAYENLGRLSYRRIAGFPVDGTEYDAIVDNITFLKAQLKDMRAGSAARNIEVTDEEESFDDENA